MIEVRTRMKHTCDILHMPFAQEAYCDAVSAELAETPWLHYWPWSEMKACP
jgi:hypothetical protein